MLEEDEALGSDAQLCMHGPNTVMLCSILQCAARCIPRKYTADHDITVSRQLHHLAQVKCCMQAGMQAQLRAHNTRCTTYT